MRFTYRSGQRVLDGFTIKRGVGRGGFGEVYFALSDGGKEVALKLLSEREIEMRGVLNCLNLKHPNLVHVYDVREDKHRDTWIVMEYVLGESLAQVVRRHRTGLPTNLAKEWFLSLARAVGYLHDQGVVHRDLKPANLFIEHGNLKVGDYGLCKSVNAGVRQTQRVGTVHYMAPEIGSGRYDKAIDIYACGVMLYEMLTGVLPFDGETDGEILMKHLTAEPDWARVSPAFVPVLKQALDKNPLKRFATMAEFARAVDAAALPVAPPAPVVVAERAPEPKPGDSAEGFVTEPGVRPATVPPPDIPTTYASPPPRAAAVPQAVAVRWAWQEQAAGATAGLFKAAALGVLALVPVAIASTDTDWGGLGKMVALTTLLSSALVAGSVGRTYRMADSWGPRLRFWLLGTGVGVAAFWLDGWTLPPAPPGVPPILGVWSVDRAMVPIAAGFLLYFGLLFGAGRWWRVAAPDRKQRVSLLPVLAVGFWSALLAFLWPWESGSIVTGALVPTLIACVAVQAAMPWSPPPLAAKVPRKLRYRNA